MFKLSQTLEAWRQDLRASNTMTEADIDELMEHILNEIDALKQKGLTDEEAFWVAKHRLGDTEALRSEFAKVNRFLIWRRRVLYILGGYLFLTLIPDFVKLLSLPLYFMKWNWAFMDVPGTSLPMPITVPLFAITTLTGILLILKSNNAFVDRLFGRLEQFANGYGLWFIFILLYFSLNVVGYWSPATLSQELGGHILQGFVLSHSYFSVFWNGLLFLTFVVVAFQHIRQEREFQIA